MLVLVSTHIIGADIFGVSTACHLAKKYPGTTISLVDQTPYPCPLAAPWDWNKVVRADYGDLFYMEKALEAIHLWRTDPLYKPFYHESGLINTDNTGLGREMIDNYKKLNTDVVPELITVEAFKKRYGSFFETTDFTGIEEIFVNEKSGWAEATKALKALTDATIKLGVNYVEGEISTLTFDDAGGCTGVKFKDGKPLTAERLILSAGALTAKLIADSAPKRPELQVGDRIVAAAVITGVVNLSAQDGKKYTEIPVTVHAIHSTQGEIMPLTPPLEANEPYTVKFCRDESYKNTCHHPASCQSFSMPPDESDEAQRSPSTGLKARLDIVRKGILGPKADKVVIDECRVCWNAVTPNQDFIIAPHPHCRRLFIATAGSFHGWKFMPTIGKYVVEMLDGTLDAALVKRWAWDREMRAGRIRTCYLRSS
ncbi:sarcosine oxidase-like protein [Mollisia scopiformis]|uniref:Sarcosine oxidase-like protein n=1 Tax=Mollisia scopiformis TaxID=149040 RepID=A0A132BCI7_MOLSC|nr:sarcosine oxidase-like protein [Mollisia scopiformis]KUJ09367.1 sarcosine oxidase-like protein [Mollisia scopiformis]